MMGVIYWYFLLIAVIIWVLIRGWGSTIITVKVCQSFQAADEISSGSVLLASVDCKSTGGERIS